MIISQSEEFDTNKISRPRKKGNRKSREELSLVPEQVDQSVESGSHSPESTGLTDYSILETSFEDSNLEDTTPNYEEGIGAGTVNEPRIFKCGKLECAFASDIGRVRQNNEDNVAAFVGMVERLHTPFGFFVVADGMGGHENGEVASSIAVNKMMESVMQEFYLPAKEGRTPGEDGETPAELMDLLITSTNQAILHAGSNYYRTSMGTTLSCIVTYGRVGIVGHVGDSRIYGVMQDTNELKLLSRDHSVIQRLVETGQITAEEAVNHPQRSYLYMSLGQRNSLFPQTEIIPLSDFSSILICSDGLWDMVGDDLILKIIDQASSPAEASRQLIMAANAAGGADNVTVLVVKL